MSELENIIETPFNNRHQCWFCGEPSSCYFSFPHQYHLVFDCSHPTLTLPCCAECSKAAIKAKVRSIWQVEQQVKKYLIKKYQKDLAIGLNWTREELVNSEFEGGNFAGFQKSAWFMFEVAKQRVNYKGWKLVLNGIAIEQDDATEIFQFDGVCYPTIEDAIVQYSENFALDNVFLRKILAILGLERFAQSVRYCRLYIGATPDEKSRALRDLS